MRYTKAERHSIPQAVYIFSWLKQAHAQPTAEAAKMKTIKYQTKLAHVDKENGNNKAPATPAAHSAQAM